MKKRALSPTGALFLSLAVPGGGQVYNGQYIKAILYGGTEVYLIKYVAWRWKWMNRYQTDFQNSDDEEYKARQFALYEKMRDSRNLHLWLTGLVVFLSIFDAYVDAHLRDFEQTDKAFDVYLAPEDDRVQLNLVYNF
jgi:TM2 domain-containing membrane protein YozV